MNKEIEKLIKKITLRDVKLSILERQTRNVLASWGEIDKILMEIEKEYDHA